MNPSKTLNYRRDIDGLRAIAVLAVIIFHLGYLPNGYLGVDIFFAISGYLITKIVYQETLDNRFSIINFYLRRIRRILPLVLFATMTALIIGLFVMLPDDFENLCQSVFATNLFANNILLLITSGDYWAIVNDYKPLMHTWSLGVEEQFYLVYPVIFLFLNGKRMRFILPVLIVLTITSLLFFWLSKNDASKFYLIQFRFFELSLGGLGAIIFKDKTVNIKYSIVLLIIVLAILLFNFPLTASVKLLLIIFSSVGLLISGNNNIEYRSILLENKFIVGIGKISFSLYMWHQIIFAYTRYFIKEEFGMLDSIILIVIIFILSIFSYFVIEQPFRNKNLIKTKKLLLIISISCLFICSTSFYLYTVGGVIFDIPELELYKSDIRKINHGSRRNIHNEYNAKIYDLEKDFTNNGKIKVLVIGDSFARDFTNVLLESRISNQIEISYVFDINASRNISKKLNEAKFVFFSDLEIGKLNVLKEQFHIDAKKIWNVGPKSFGTNNGIFYNKKRDNNYCSQRTHINQEYFERNSLLKKQWGERYIDLIGSIVDKENKVPVFTPECKFISQDCAHLTRAGAVYFAKLLDINKILGLNKSN